MWAPADLFGPGFSDFTRLGRAVFSYFYQHLMVLAAALILAAGLIAVATALGNRRSRAS